LNSDVLVVEGKDEKEILVLFDIIISALWSLTLLLNKGKMLRGWNNEDEVEEVRNL
jgi:hypothetical protein